MNRLALRYASILCIAAGMTDAAIAAPAAAPAKPRILQNVTAIRADVLPPVKAATKRGGGTGPGETYPFEKLEIGQSFGIVGRNAKRMNSTVYSAMARFGTVAPKVDKAGAPVLNKKTGKPQMTLNRTRVFKAFDVDPTTDVDGATVRIFRMADAAAGTSVDAAE